MSITRTCLLALLAAPLFNGAALGSQVTISGAVDVAVFRNFDGNKRVGSVQRSHIIFSGSEDLGGGLAATFKLQHRFEPDTGISELSGKPFWHGESTVGLKGSLGQLRVGRALDVLSNNDWAFDPWYNYDRIASPAWNNWHWNYATDRSSNSGSAEYGRLNQGLFLDSAVVSGWSVHLSGSVAKQAGQSGRNKGLALKYTGETWAAMAAAQKNRSGDSVQFLGLSWHSGQWTLMGAIDRSEFEATPKSVAKVSSLGARYAMGASTIKVGWAGRNVDDAKSHFVGLGADHSLSKRTNVYASFGRQKPNGAATANAYGVGMTHSF